MRYRLHVRMFSPIMAVNCTITSSTVPRILGDLAQVISTLRMSNYPQVAVEDMELPGPPPDVLHCNAAWK